MRVFPQTGFRIDEDSFWDYFRKRGGVDTFGYPVSQTSSLLGTRVQMFQRLIMQLRPDGRVGTLNLLDAGLLPFTHINGSNFPAPDPAFDNQIPPPSDANYLSTVIRFVQANAPDTFDGHQVNFGRRSLKLCRSARPSLTARLRTPPRSWLASTSRCGACRHPDRPTIQQHELHLPAFSARHHALRRQLGSKRLDQLVATPVVIQRAYAHLADRYAPKTLNFTHNVFHLAFEAAKRSRLIDRNPLDDVRPPRRPASYAEDRVLDLEDLLIVLQAIAGHPYEPAWRFVLGTGVRWGEAAGLRWADVSLATGREQATIRRAATRVKGDVLLKEPKTRKGRRSIPLMADTVEALKRQQVRCQELKSGAADWTPNDLVFPNESGHPLRNNRVLELFKERYKAVRASTRRGRCVTCGTRTPHCTSGSGTTYVSPRTCWATRGAT